MCGHGVNTMRRSFTNTSIGSVDRSKVPNSANVSTNLNLPTDTQASKTDISSIPSIPSNIKTRVDPQRFIQTAEESEGTNFIVSLPLEIRDLDFKAVTLVEDKDNITNEDHIDDEEKKKIEEDPVYVVRERSEYDNIPKDEDGKEFNIHNEISGKLAIPVKSSRPMVRIRATKVDMSYFDEDNESDTPDVSFMSGNTSNTGLFSGNLILTTLLTDFTWKTWGDSLFTSDVWLGVFMEAFAGQSDGYTLNRDENVYMGSNEPPLKSTSTSFTISSLGVTEKFERDTRGIDVTSLTEPTRKMFETWVKENDAINKA